MKSSVFLQSLAAVCIAAAASTVSGQTAIQLFSPANVRVSTQGTGYGANENVFNTTILNLSVHIADPGKDFIHCGRHRKRVGRQLYYACNEVGGTPADICMNGTMENGNQQNCFTSNYASQASAGELTGHGSR